MAVIRQQNFLGQERVDVPHLRALEAGVAGDFDVLAGRILAGETPVVVRGFDILLSGAIGASAELLTIQTAGSLLIHYTATDSGSIFDVPQGTPTEVLNGTNPNVQGSFTANSINYIGVDIIRSVDDSTADTAMFLNDSGTETPEIVPMARTLKYIINISPDGFDSHPNLCPLYKVVTDSAGRVASIEDARNLLCRLGTGGTTPNGLASFQWPGGRTENSFSSMAPIGGDRSIKSIRDLFRAMMSRIWETGGGEYWYSATSDHNVMFISNGSVFGIGRPFEVIASRNIHWKGLSFVFENSTAVVNEIQDQLTNSAGLTDLADGECVYVDLDRSVDRTVAEGNPLVAKKAPLTTLGTGTIPGSRYIFAWRRGNIFYLRNYVTGLT